jgi:hypothetical protein
MPWFHEETPAPQPFELGANKVIGVPALKKEIQALDYVRSRISPQGNLYPLMR